MQRFLALTVLLQFGALAHAAMGSPAEIHQLINELGAQDYRQRETASRRLEQLGAAAVEPLRAALDSGDAEIRHRAELIICHIENTDPAFRDKQEQQLIRAMLLMLCSREEETYARAHDKLLSMPGAIPILREASKSQDSSYLLSSRSKKVLRLLKKQQKSKNE